MQTPWGPHPAAAGPRGGPAPARPAVTNRAPVRVQVRPAACAALLHHLHPHLRTDRGAVRERDHVQHTQVLRGVLPGGSDPHAVRAA